MKAAMPHLSFMAHCVVNTSLYTDPVNYLNIHEYACYISIMSQYRVLQQSGLLKN